MNNFIINELRKCKHANIPGFNFKDTELTIPMVKVFSKSNVVDFLQKDHYYIIEVENYIINPPENFTLASNWNHGINPKSKYLLVTFLKEVGKMKCFDGCGYDLREDCPLDDVYSNLWLPEKGFKIVKEISS